MTFKYKGKKYEVVELVEPACSKDARKTSDIIAIFELRKNPDPKIRFEQMRFINWMYGASFFENLDQIPYGETKTAKELLIELIEEAKNYQHFVP